MIFKGLSSKQVKASFLEDDSPTLSLNTVLKLKKNFLAPRSKFIDVLCHKHKHYV